MKDPKQRLKKSASTLGLLGFGLAVGALFAEGAVRVVLRQPITLVTPGLYAPDPPRLYRLTPDYRGSMTNVDEFTTEVAVNSIGLRGPEIRPKAAVAQRILMLGDSFVFGWGVEAEEGMAARLQESLQAEHPGLDVVNAGHPGFGTQDELDWLVHHGLELEPDLVVVAIMMGNDLLDATAKHHHERISEVLPEAGTAEGLELWFYRRSHFFRLLKRVGGAKLKSWFGLPEPWAISYLRDMMTSLAIEPPALALEGRQASRQALADLAELAAERDIRLAAILIPVHLQVDPAMMQMICSLFDLDPAAHDPDVPTRFFEQTLGELGIPVHDLTPRMRQAVAAGEKLYYRYDPHWTAGGHRLATDGLLQLLEQEQLLSESDSAEDEAEPGRAIARRAPTLGRLYTPNSTPRASSPVITRMA